MSQPASFDQPRPGETILACSHNAKKFRRQFFVGHEDGNGKPTGLGTWVKTKDNPNGLYVRWVSLCCECAEIRGKTPLQLAARVVIWQRKEPG